MPEKVEPCGCSESDALRDALTDVLTDLGPWCDNEACQCSVRRAHRLLADLKKKREALAQRTAESWDG